MSKFSQKNVINLYINCHTHQNLFSIIDEY